MENTLCKHYWLGEHTSDEMSNFYCSGLKDGKGYKAVPANACSLAEAINVPVTISSWRTKQNIKRSHSISGMLTQTPRTNKILGHQPGS
eukprot:1162047-Pelagomonas_calceolata.AAC.1